jgi:hypothetical protein
MSNSSRNIKPSFASDMTLRQFNEELRSTEELIVTLLSLFKDLTGVTITALELELIDNAYRFSTALACTEEETEEAQ